MVSMIIPGLSASVFAAGEPSSTFLIFMTKAGGRSSMPIPTGPKRSMVCGMVESAFGRVEKRGGRV